MKIQLRPYQVEAIRAIVRDLRTHDKVGLILPTGAGKTEIFINVIAEYLDENPDKVVMVLSHMGILIQQTLDRFRKRKPNVAIGVFQGSSKPLPTDQVILSTMQTMCKPHKVAYLNERMIRSCGLIVVDEAHRIACESYLDIFNLIPGAKRLGCTATPFRDRKIMIEEFSNISYSASLEQMISEGYLVEPELITYPYSIKDEVERYKSIVTAYKAGHMKQKGIVFCCTEQQTQDAAFHFERAGIRAKQIVAGTCERERQMLLSQFSDGDLDILTTCDVLTAGYDCDLIQVIFMPNPTTSPTLFMQRIGRGLRTSNRIYKKKCTIYYYGKKPTFRHNGVSLTIDSIKKRGGPDKSYDTVKEDFELNDYIKNPQGYKVTAEMLARIEFFDANGFKHIADQLNHKAFPPKLMGDIGKLIERAMKSHVNNSKASHNQIMKLCALGIHPDYATKYTAQEAKLVIEQYANDSNSFWKWDPVVQSGNFRGRKVSTIPRVSRHIIMKKAPNSPEAKLIRECLTHNKERMNG